MIYFLPLIFSLPLSYGIDIVTGGGSWLYIFIAVVIISYILGAVYQKYIGLMKQKISWKRIAGSIVLSVILALFIFISSAEHVMSFIVFLAMAVGGLLIGLIIFDFLSTKIEGVSISGMFALVKQGLRSLLGVKFIDYLGLVPPILFMVSYLLLENINVIGDESGNLSTLRTLIYWVGRGPNLFYKLKAWYVFSTDYPPFFFLTSLPFLKFFTDWVVGGRVFVVLLGVLDVCLLYLFLKRHLSTMAALLGGILLTCSFSFINASRVYQLEIMLIALLLAVLILMSRFLETSNRNYLLASGIIIALGMLSKYNFFIYAAVPVLFYLGAAYYKKPGNRKLVNDLLLLGLPSLLFVSPWFIYTYIANPSPYNPLSRFFGYKTMGRFGSNVSLTSAFTQIWQQRNVYFSDFVYWLLALLVLVFLIICIIKLVKREKLWDHMGELFWMPLAFILAVTIFLNLIGLILLRWNLSYIFIPIVMAFLFDRVILGKRIAAALVGILLYIFFILLFVNVAVRHTPGGGIFHTDVVAKRLLPNPLTTGAKESVAVIKNDWLGEKRNLGETITVGFIGHINEGLHGHAFKYYGTVTGFTKWQESDVGILNDFIPTGLSVFVGTDYLVYIPGNQYNFEDPTAPQVLLRYQWLIENAPVSYTSCTRAIGTINSRFGNVVVLKIDHSCFTQSTYFDLIDAGRQYDAQQPSFLLFWDVEDLRYELQFNLVDASQKSRLCDQIAANIVAEKDGFTPFNFDLIQSNLTGICQAP